MDSFTLHLTNLNGITKYFFRCIFEFLVLSISAYKHKKIIAIDEHLNLWFTLLLFGNLSQLTRESAPHELLTPTTITFPLWRQIFSIVT